MKYIKIIMIFAASLLLFNCAENKDTQLEKTKVDSPPSLTKKNTAEEIKTIQLDEKMANELKIQTVKVSVENSVLKINAPAFAFPAPEYTSAVSAPLSGRIISIEAHEGENVKKGQLLCEIESLEFGTLVADYLQNTAEESYQKNRYDRLLQLREKNISSQSEMEKAKSDWIRAGAAVKAAYSKLRAVGVSDSEIEKLASQKTIDPKLKIYSPIEGTIDQHLIELGESVSTYSKMLTIINNKKVLVKGYLAPEDGSFVNEGDKVIILLRGNSSNKIVNTISSINPALDEDSRSIVVNIITDTKSGWPKPGENLRLEIETSGKESAYSIPVSAITYDNDDAIVFVKTGDKTYEVRKVNIKTMNDNEAIILSGLNEDEEIAVSQIFSLKALARYEQIAEE